MSISSLVPCAVIVDTRNVHGQGRKLFGGQRRPMAAGIRAAMRLYGFDAVDIFAGVATRSRAQRASAQLELALGSNQTYADRLRGDGVTVLEGQLAERPQGSGGTKMDEKQVDVLLALQVADLVETIGQLGAAYEHIVVLSEDMDLMPAYEYAARRGVKVYAAAFDTIHARPEQVKWLILHEDAMASLLDLRWQATAADMRSYFARVAVRDIPVSATNWKALKTQPPGNVTLSNNRGYRATWNTADPVHRGDRIALYPDSLTLGSEVGRFPHLSLSDSPPADPSVPMRNIVTASVRFWSTPTRMKVRLETVEGETATLSVSPGAAMAGDTVAVYREPAGANSGRYFVGQTARVELPSPWDKERLQEVTVVEDRSTAKGPLLAETRDGQKVLVHSALLDHVAPGGRLLVSGIGIHERSGLPEATPLTCCLPGRASVRMI